MGIRYLTEDIIILNLPGKPHRGNELERMNELASDGCNCDVIMDFSGVEILISASIANLILLHEFLSASNRHLVVCNVPLPIQCIFIRIGLSTYFEFAHDQSAALEAVRQHHCKKSHQS